MTAEELQSIRNMMREENATIRADMKQEVQKVHDEVAALEKRMMHGVAVLLDTEFKTNYGLLADEIHALGEKVPTIDDMDIIDDRLQDLEDSDKHQNLEIAALKKAQ